ncbi:GntR family transcriptional regulator [Actinomadura barringtoniae]|uniref:GntR family transcriptional regulator n=1 Tax=Actinomadura barringtoniae TaxID=1427535 RepID=A0A939P9X9_9ACTN|nr:GntR family transcriptional regulator [Actinomadura barringtoniae]MBO2448872.1 GntR family transcriptional regulator [Actinomadura barringtoniae]
MTAAPESPSWLGDIKASRHELDRSSTAAKVAVLLRQQIITGRLVPGTQLPEKELAEAADVSRNTLREAFRLLVQERLLVHEFNRGVFVRTLSAADIGDIYRARRILEIEGVRNASAATAADLAHVEAAVREGEQATAEERFPDVGTADLHFHQAVVGLCGSPRLNEMMGLLLAELRLAFHHMGSPGAFHGPYLTRNRRLADLIQAGDIEAAERELRDYLDNAEAQLTAASG